MYRGFIEIFSHLVSEFLWGHITITKVVIVIGPGEVNMLIFIRKTSKQESELKYRINQVQLYHMNK